MKDVYIAGTWGGVLPVANHYEIEKRLPCRLKMNFK